MLEIGSVLDGKYKILNQIGKGGMSVVYLAMNEKANQQWAVKEVRKDGVRNYEIVKQGLVAETDILKKLNHPHPPRIIDVIDKEDSFVIVMDYIEGNSLAKALEEHGALPEEYVVFWAKQICDVLQYLHTRQPPIIYRDLKTSNIMLKPDGNISIIDFGTAREFKAGNVKDTVTLGTEGYAAPEQYGNQGQTDPRTDIYNLGATMYHLVTGYTPHPSAEPYHGMVPIREIDPSLSPDLEQIILKCTRQNPRDRYQDCVELMYDLEHIGTGDKNAVRKVRTFFVTAALCVVMVLAGSLCLGISGSQVTDTYESKIAEASDGTSALSNSERIALCEEAIGLDAGTLDAYETLLNIISSTESYCEDANITSAEFSRLSLLSKNISVIADKYDDDTALGELLYDTGHAIWFYYLSSEGSDEEMRMNQALSWFELATKYLPEGNQYYTLANLYYNIADYNLHIQTKIDDDTDKGEYGSYWTELTQMVESASTETDYAQLQIYRMAVNSIIKYYKQFSNDGVSVSDMLSMLDEAESVLSQMSFNSEANATACEDVLASIETARKNVNLMG